MNTIQSRKYTKELLNALTDKQYISTERGLDILVKPIPDDNRKGVMDPRLLVSTKQMIKDMPKGKDAPKLDMNNPESVRKMMDGVKSIPIVKDILEQRTTVLRNEYEIPIRIYSKKDSQQTNLPIFYYIHGGGFIAGSPDVVAEMCKLVVENTGGIAVSVDYRLAPENPFPTGLDDCYAVLQWIYNNAESLGGDKEKICISGDSAGGNLATVCALKDKEAGTGMVKAQALIYPTVNMAGVEDEDFSFSMKEYNIALRHMLYIRPMIKMMAESTTGDLASAIGVDDLKDPYASPYLADLTGMPPCIILYGEHDYLRVENESYARKLKKAGVPVKAVRYLGLSHGFADIVGGLPQAEDCMKEISNFMTEYLR